MKLAEYHVIIGDLTMLELTQLHANFGGLRFWLNQRPEALRNAIYRMRRPAERLPAELRSEFH